MQYPLSIPARFYKRSRDKSLADGGVEAGVMGVHGDRVLIHARWRTDRGGLKSNILNVSRKYWTERYGVTPEAAL